MSETYATTSIGQQNQMIQKVQTKRAITSETLIHLYIHYKDV